LQLLDEARQTEVILRGYRAVRLDFGVNRIHLGAHLHLIKEHKIYKQFAETWEEFLASENINPNAARQYIKVAKKFVYEMNIDDETLRKLSMAGISALEKATLAINDENKDEILETLMALSERDAIQRIIEISSGVPDNKPQQPTLRVLRMLRDYHELPPDLQQDFRHRLVGHEDSRRQRRGEAPPAAEISESRAAKTTQAADKASAATRMPIRFRGAAPKKPSP
jgi:hypothetical protein